MNSNFWSSSNATITVFTIIVRKPRSGKTKLRKCQEKKRLKFCLHTAGFCLHQKKKTKNVVKEEKKQFVYRIIGIVSKAFFTSVNIDLADCLPLRRSSQLSLVLPSDNTRQLIRSTNLSVRSSRHDAVQK
jgi:hypothetical protein